MFFTHASKSGNLLSKYNRQCQLVTLKEVYLQFYDSISDKDSLTISSKNKDRVRKSYNYRVKVMNSLKAEVESTNYYGTMHSNEIREYQSEAVSKATQGRSKLDCLYFRYVNEDMTPYVSASSSIVFDPLSQCFIMEGNFNNYDNMDSRSMEEIIDESTQSNIPIYLTNNRSANY